MFTRDDLPNNYAHARGILLTRLRGDSPPSAPSLPPASLSSLAPFALERSGGLTEGKPVDDKKGGKNSQFMLNRNAAVERLVIFVYFFLGMKDVDVLCWVHETHICIWFLHMSECNPSGLTGG